MIFELDSVMKDTDRGFKSFNRCTEGDRLQTFLFRLPRVVGAEGLAISLHDPPHYDWSGVFFGSPKMFSRLKSEALLRVDNLTRD